MPAISKIIATPISLISKLGPTQKSALTSMLNLYYTIPTSTKVVTYADNKLKVNDSTSTFNATEATQLIFDLSDSSNSGHPFTLATANDESTNYANVTSSGTPGQAGATLTTTLPAYSNNQTLWWYCSSHSSEGASFAITEAPIPPPSGYQQASGTGDPVISSTSTGTTPSGWTAVINASRDDGNVNIPFGFNWKINSTNYSSVYVGSNNYMTFGSGQNTYSGYSFSSWSIPKIILTQTSDNSYQYITYKQFDDYTRIRFEGNASTSGGVGSGNIVWEATFFPATVTLSGFPMVEIRCGSNGRGTSKTMGIAGPSSSTAYASHNSLVNESVVYVAGNENGTAWTAYTGFSVSLD
jgi:hypothetical protein